MATAKVFMSGRSQAVRLPKEFRVDASELAIRKEGDSIVLTPINSDWARFFTLLQDFENVDSIERNQPTSQQIRKSLDDKMKFLLDTDICIYLLKRQPSVLAQFTQHRLSDIGISAITIAELEYGVAKTQSTKNKRTLASWLALLQQPPFDTGASSTYGRVRAELELKGTPIGPLDTLIAAHALALGLTLVTNNVREFKRISGLKIEKWTTP